MRTLSVSAFTATCVAFPIAAGNGNVGPRQIAPAGKTVSRCSLDDASFGGVKIPPFGGDMKDVAPDPIPRGVPPAAGHDDAGPLPLGRLALLGAAGAVLLALAGDLPGSPYGPRAAGLWPLAGRGQAPTWEGPKVPTWARLSDQVTGVGSGRLVTTLLVIAGVGLLAVAWGLVWRMARRHSGLGLRRLWWVVGSWTAPLFLAAPFASQDVWHYGAEGKMVVDGLGDTSRPRCSVIRCGRWGSTRSGPSGPRCTGRPHSISRPST